MKQYGDKLIYITGGSSGIGLEMAKELARRGAHIVIFARSSGKLKSAEEEIRKACVTETQKIVSMTMDVADNGSVQKTLESAVADIGLPDMVISNAGIGMAEYFENITYEDFDRLMKVNLYGTRNVIAALLPKMKDRKGGHIVVMASTAGLVPMFGYTAYGTSKYAVIGFSECLRSELAGSGVALSVICPPEVDTPLIHEEAKTIPPEARAVKDTVGLMSAEKVAGLIVRALKKKKFLILPGFSVKFFYFTHRIAAGRLTRFVSDLIVKQTRKRISKKGVSK